ncbi:hypothetical protein ACFX1Q_017462 [Malus domestica]
MAVQRERGNLPEALQRPSRRRRAINNLDIMLRLQLPPCFPFLLFPPLPPGRSIRTRAGPVRKVLIYLHHRLVWRGPRRATTLGGSNHILVDHAAVYAATP